MGIISRVRGAEVRKFCHDGFLLGYVGGFDRVKS
jgi:hypothetical protein